MSNLTIQAPIPQAIPLPAPRVPIAIRAATLEDVAFIDALQKKQSKQVGFFPRKAIEGKITLGHVLVAEANEPRPSGSVNLSLPDGGGLLGYLIGNDQYFKRDDVGCIFQINVLPEYRRSLVAAALLKAQFERSAYGCRLYCCWCAQDIEANRFWESMGFVALAFRSGSATRGGNGGARTHVFWQKRIRAGDMSTPWWYPCTTSGGAIRGQRLVFPIPPGTHWSDEMPVVLPESRQEDNAESMRVVNRRGAKPRQEVSAPPLIPQTPNKPAAVGAGRLQFFNVAPAAVVKPAVNATPSQPVKIEKKPREKAKHDPKQLAMARELRDRYLEQYNHQAGEQTAGKYQLETSAHAEIGIERALPAIQAPRLLTAA